MQEVLPMSRDHHWAPLLPMQKGGHVTLQDLVHVGQQVIGAASADGVQRGSGSQIYSRISHPCLLLTVKQVRMMSAVSWQCWWPDGQSERKGSTRGYWSLGLRWLCLMKAVQQQDDCAGMCSVNSALGAVLLIAWVGPVRWNEMERMAVPVLGGLVPVSASSGKELAEWGRGWGAKPVDKPNPTQPNQQVPFLQIKSRKYRITQHVTKRIILAPL